MEISTPLNASTKDRLIHKYLNSHAHGPDLEKDFFAQGTGSSPFERVCVIPLCGEGIKFENIYRKRLVEVANDAQLRVLYILVLNSAFERSPTYHLENNEQLLKLWNIEATMGQKFWREPKGFASFLVLNYHSETFRFPSKHGVGLARKIGCDVALKLMSKGVIQHSLIYNTDGDALIPFGYFSLALHKQLGAGVAPFKHVSSGVRNSNIFKAAELYDSYLRYFCAGLRFAKSKFAYIPIGSCLILDAESYAAVRGFPDKLAGEDFHILSKIAKLRSVENLNPESSGFIELEGRESDRVPFGTGAKIKEWLPYFESQNINVIEIESPLTFLGLKFALSFLESYPESPAVAAEFEVFSDFDKSNIKNCLDKVTDLEFHRERLSKLHVNDKSQISKKLIREVFDGLQQVRFIHALSATGGPFSKVPARKLLLKPGPFNDLFERHHIDPVLNNCGII